MEEQRVQEGRRRRRRRRARARRRRLLVLGCLLLVLFWHPWSGKPSQAEGPRDEDAVPAAPAVPAWKDTALAREPAEAGLPEYGPDWVVQDILPVNEYSRPGEKLDVINGVVVHYTGNPGTTAEQNRSYFNNLATTHETYASSHFVVGIDGTVIQCVPLNEVAYCSSSRNSDTISIECCHADESGEFSQETIDSLLCLLDWLTETYSLTREDILRHYDVTGKECPRWYVRNPEAWEKLLDEVVFPG